MADTITVIAWISRTSLIWFVVLVALLIVFGVAILLIHRRRPRLLRELAQHPFAKYVTLSLIAHLAIAIWLCFTSLFNRAPAGPGPKAIVVQLGEVTGNASQSMSPTAEAKPWDAPAVESVPLKAADLPEQTVATPEVDRPAPEADPVARSQPDFSPFNDAPAVPLEQPSPWDNSAPAAAAAAALAVSGGASELDSGSPSQPDAIDVVADDAAPSIPPPVATAAARDSSESPTTSASQSAESPTPNSENEIQQPTYAVEEPVAAEDAEAVAHSIDQLAVPDAAQVVAADADANVQHANPQPADVLPMDQQPSTLQQPQPTKTAQHDTSMSENSLQVADVQDPVASQVPRSEQPSTAFAASTPNATQDSSDRRDVPINQSGPISTSAPIRQDGKAVPPIYRDRWDANRQAIARSRGGSLDAERSVQAALQWIAFAQSSDGRWDASNFGSGKPTYEGGHDRQGAGLHADTGITGLALLAFLGAGHTQNEGAYAENIRNGINFLLREQRRRRDGAIVGDASAFAAMYCHGIATLALSEAWSLTGDPQLTEPVKRAISFTISSQNRRTGGWRYQPQQHGDTSQLGWQLMAMTSAHYAGLSIPVESWTLAGGFLNRVARGNHGGLAAYRAELPRPSSAMTAESLLCRLFLQTHPDHPLVKEAADYLMRDLPGNGRVNYYYWYYGTLALYHLQDHHWQRWNPAVQQALIGRQQPDGSWSADSVWGTSGGKVYSTSLGALTLEVYYRYRPLTESRQRETTAWNR